MLHTRPSLCTVPQPLSNSFPEQPPKVIRYIQLPVPECRCRLAFRPQSMAPLRHHSTITTLVESCLPLCFSYNLVVRCPPAPSACLTYQLCFVTGRHIRAPFSRIRSGRNWVGHSCAFGSPLLTLRAGRGMCILSSHRNTSEPSRPSVPATGIGHCSKGTCI